MHLARRAGWRCTKLRGRTALSRNTFGVRLLKLVAPFPNGFVADHNAALGHHFFDVAIAQRETKVQPSAMANNRRRKAVASAFL